MLILKMFAFLNQLVSGRVIFHSLALKKGILLAWRPLRKGGFSEVAEAQAYQRNVWVPSDSKPIIIILIVLRVRKKAIIRNRYNRKISNGKGKLRKNPNFRTPENLMQST